MALVQNAVRMFLPVIFGARKIEATNKKIEEMATEIPLLECIVRNGIATASGSAWRYRHKR